MTTTGTRLLALALAVWSWWGLSGVDARPLNVVASFTVLADVAREVGGSDVTVLSLVPPNGDPHSFEPTPNDAKALGTADVALLSSDGFEVWFGRLAKAAGYKSRAIAVSEGLETLGQVEDGKRTADPHVWNDPRNVMQWADRIARAFAAADPAGAATFQANADRYLAQLKGADADAHAKLDAVPAARRRVLTSHDAFGYFARAYSVTFVAPIGLSTDAEPSAATVARVIRQIRAEEVKVYFFENAADPRLVKQIAEATGAAPGGELFVESLSAPGGPADTYLRMFRGNVDAIAAALTR